MAISFRDESVGTYEVVRTESGQFYWRVSAPGTRYIRTSDEHYGNPLEAMHALAAYMVRPIPAAID